MSTDGSPVERRDLSVAPPVAQEPPGDSESHRLIEEGIAHQAAGRPREAANSYRRALDHDPRNSAAANGLGLLLARYGTGTDHFDEALRLADRAVVVASSPRGRAAALNTRGEIRFRRGELHDAIEDSEACLRALGAAAPSATRAGALRRIGSAHGYLGQTDRATRALRDAVAADPADVDGRIALARVAARAGDHAGAVDEYTRAVTIVAGAPERLFNPERLLATLLNDRGCAYSAIGDRARADADFGHAIRIDPGYAYAYVNRAFQAEWRGDRELMHRCLVAGLDRAEPDDFHLVNTLLSAAATGAHGGLILDVLLDRGRITPPLYGKLRKRPRRTGGPPATIGDPADEVPAGPMRPGPEESAPRIRIVVFAANPLDGRRLALDDEIREITAKLRASRYRDAFEMVPCLATRADDLLQYLNEYTPGVVHFSGHGSRAGGIVLASDRSREHVVDAPALGALFRTMRGDVRIVVLNACHSAVQAAAIGEHVDYVVGMRASIRDDAAAVFAAAFYRALGFDRTVAEAFDQAKTALLLAGIPEDDIPDLLVRPGAPPRLWIGR